MLKLKLLYAIVSKEIVFVDGMKKWIESLEKCVALNIDYVGK